MTFMQVLFHFIYKRKALICPIFLLFALIAVGSYLFLPRHYPLPPFEKRATTQYFTLPSGEKIGYTLVHAKGEKKKYPIIYLHGGPGGRVSNQTIATLSPLSEEGFDILFYDQIGSGYSDRLNNINDYTLERHIQDLKAVISMLKTEKVLLVGQSWGCILGTHFAIQYPRLIEKMILINPGPLYPYAKRLENIPIPDSLPLHSPRFTNAEGNAKMNNWRTATIRFFATQCGIKIATDAEADAFFTYAGFEINKSCYFDTSQIATIENTPSIPNLGGYYAGLMTFHNLLKVKEMRPAEKNTHAHLLVIKAQYDNQKWGIMPAYFSLFKHTQCKVIHNAGHIIEYEKGAVLYSTIRDFLCTQDG